MSPYEVLAVLAASLAVGYVILDVVQFRRQLRRWQAEDERFQRLVDAWQRKRRGDP